jgi:cardiolipin synthase
MNPGVEKTGLAARREDIVANGDRSSKVLTLPNILSLMRILLTPVFIWALVCHRPWLAFGIFLLAGATDALDGFTARYFRLKTNVGLWLDPMGDKILLTAALVTLTLPALAQPNTLPLWLTTICIGRDVLIALGALIYVWIRGRTQFRPSLLGKATTICEVMVLLVVLLYNGLGISPGPMGVFYVLTAALAGLSGVHYIISGMARFFATGKKPGA